MTTESWGKQMSCAVGAFLSVPRFFTYLLELKVLFTEPLTHQSGKRWVLLLTASHGTRPSTQSSWSSAPVKESAWLTDATATSRHFGFRLPNTPNTHHWRFVVSHNGHNKVIGTQGYPLEGCQTRTEIPLHPESISAAPRHGSALLNTTRLTAPERPPYWRHRK